MIYCVKYADYDSVDKINIDSNLNNRQKRELRMRLARQKGRHSKVEWEEIKSFFNNHCVRCGSEKGIEKDHIKPIYQGGSDGCKNLQPLCYHCNCQKGSESVDYRLKFCMENNLFMPLKWIEDL